MALKSAKLVLTRQSSIFFKKKNNSGRGNEEISHRSCLAEGNSYSNVTFSGKGLKLTKRWPQCWCVILYSLGHIKPFVNLYRRGEENQICQALDRGTGYLLVILLKPILYYQHFSNALPHPTFPTCTFLAHCTFSL